MIHSSNIPIQNKMNLLKLLLLLSIFVSSCTGNKKKLNDSKLSSVSQIILKAERFSIEKKNGYTIEEILIVCHGGAHNDTICMAERKTQGNLF